MPPLKGKYKIYDEHIPKENSNWLIIRFRKSNNIKRKIIIKIKSSFPRAEIEHLKSKL